MAFSIRWTLCSTQPVAHPPTHTAVKLRMANIATGTTLRRPRYPCRVGENWPFFDLEVLLGGPEEILHDKWLELRDVLEALYRLVEETDRHLDHLVVRVVQSDLPLLQHEV